MERWLSEFENAAAGLERRGPDVLVTRLDFDSREVRPGSLFFALPGLHSDGHDYVEAALTQGAAAIVHEHPLAAYRPGIAYLRVPDSRRAMSPLSAAFYGHPSRRLKVTGVTGTDGKSSTVSFLTQLLRAAGAKAGFFSTVEMQLAGDPVPNSLRQSTPEAPQIHGFLAEALEAGLEHVVLESTSHGLSPRTSRLADVTYSAAVFTNVTSEHLEFHGTVEVYRADKARLFAALDQGPETAFGVVNRDDPHWRLFAEASRRPVQTYAQQDPEAQLRALDLNEGPDGLSFTLHWQGRTRPVTVPLAGRFNVDNLMAALLAASGLLQRDPLDLAELLPGLRGVKGRMRLVDQGQPFRVIVDYAHTPGSFEKVLPAVRAATPGRLTVVFGSGGERDRVKRPQQGALADRWADVIFLTDEDPRYEDPEQILSDIAAGVRGKIDGVSLLRVRPRQEAVFQALAAAQPGDTVLLLGKGHESSLVVGAQKQPYDEETVARDALTRLGWTRSAL